MKNKNVIKSLLLSFSLLLLLSTAYSQEYRGKVVGIADGDISTFLTGDMQQIKVRLAEIDTPERAQPFGTRARQALFDLIFAKEVRVVRLIWTAMGGWLAMRMLTIPM